MLKTGLVSRRSMVLTLVEVTWAIGNRTQDVLTEGSKHLQSPLETMRRRYRAVI